MKNFGTKDIIEQDGIKIELGGVVARRIQVISDCCECKYHVVTKQGQDLCLKENKPCYSANIPRWCKLTRSDNESLWEDKPKEFCDQIKDKKKESCPHCNDEKCHWILHG